MNTLKFGIRNIHTLSSKSSNALEIFKKSCYNKCDFKINQNNPVQEALMRFSVLNISSLAVLDDEKNLVGVCSKRDYINKIAVYNKSNTDIKVKDICTNSENIIVARTEDSIEMCMNKMLFKNVHHLVILDDKDKTFVGMISMKDIIQDLMKNKDEIITRLTDFNKGRGAFFGSE